MKLAQQAVHPGTGKARVYPEKSARVPVAVFVGVAAQVLTDEIEMKLLLVRRLQLAHFGAAPVDEATYRREFTLPVERFYAPAEYPALAHMGQSLGLAHVEAGPLVRSSFEADRVADEIGAGVI